MQVVGQKIPVRVDASVKLSPLARLLESIPESLYRIAPERLDELRESLKDARLEICSKHSWVAHYEFGSKTLRISMRTFERTWAACFAYLSLHDLVGIPAMQEGQTEADLTADSRVKLGMDLLSWAVSESGDSSSLFAAAAGDPLAAATDELSLCAIAFLLHHELAHHRLGHDHPPEDDAASIDRERDADREAAEWSLGRIPTGSCEYDKRLLGACMAMVLLTAHSLETNRLSAWTHPRAFDRLFHLLSERADDDAGAWCFALWPVKLHLDRLTVQAATGPFDTCKDALDACVEQLAELAELQGT